MPDPFDSSIFLDCFLLANSVFDILMGADGRIGTNVLVYLVLLGLDMKELCFPVSAYFKFISTGFSV